MSEIHYNLISMGAIAQKPAAGNRRSSYIYWTVAVVLVLTAMLRILPLSESRFWDETVFLQNAMVMLGERDNYDELYYRPPALPIIFAAGFLIREHIYTAQVLVGLLGAIAVLFMFLYARTAFGTAAALAASLLFAFTPYLVLASHSLLTGIPAMAFMLAAMWLYGKNGSVAALLSGIVFAIAVQTRFTSLFLGLFFALHWFFFPGQIRRLLWLGVGFAAALTPYLAWNQIRYGNFIYPFSFARRIVTEWNLPVPAVFYLDGFNQIFPVGIQVFAVIGMLKLGLGIAQYCREKQSEPIFPLSRRIGAENARLLIILLWGVAFFIYMLSIPHKEVRYLLPLAIPMTVFAGRGMVLVLRWVWRWKPVPRTAGLVTVALGLLLMLGPSFAHLSAPWVNRHQAEIVQIALYLRDHSAPDDTLYSPHEFPVLAYYTGLRTVSLLPIQDDFEGQWKNLMDAPGYLIYFRPEGIGENHSLHRTFKPDAAFLKTTPGFELVKDYTRATVYRYDPAQ